MSQLYARVFVKILQSSLADDWYARHVFEDCLKLASPDGIVDVTRSAFCRITNAPKDVVDKALAVLEATDSSSRDSSEDGRRLVRLDEHRDWGWRIVNWDKYEAIRCKNDEREVERNRKRRSLSKSSPTTPPEASTPTPAPTSDTSSSSGAPGVFPETSGNFPGNFRNEPTPNTLWPTLPEVLRVASMRAIPPECAEAWWLVHDARGGLDTRGQPIVRWEPSLTAYWASWRANETKDRLSRPNGRRGKPESKQIQEVIEMPILGQPRKPA